MNLKFCRGFGEEEKNQNEKQNLSVELKEEKDKQSAGRARWYQLGCLVLGLLCLVLLLIVIFLSVKLQSRTVAPVLVDPNCSFPPPGQVTEPECLMCASNWHLIGRSCFYFSTDRLNWDQSQRNCSLRGGYLAVVNTTTLQHNLTTFKEKVGKLGYWIGLRKTGNVWRWVDNSTMQQSYWYKSDLEEDCAFLDTKTRPEGNWLAEPCESKAYFICQLPLRSGP